MTEETKESIKIEDIIKNPLLSCIAKLRTLQKNYEPIKKQRLNEQKILVDEIRKESEKDYYRDLDITKEIVKLIQNFLDLMLLFKTEMSEYDKTLKEIMSFVETNYSYFGPTREQQGLDKVIPMSMTKQISAIRKKRKIVPPSQEELEKQKKAIVEIIELSKEYDSTTEVGVWINNLINKCNGYIKEDRAYMPSFHRSVGMGLKHRKEKPKEIIEMWNKVLAILKKYDMNINVRVLDIG